MPNALLDKWTTPFGIPPFEDIEPADFRLAFDEALAEHAGEVDAIAASDASPTFNNTIVALEKSGAALDRVCKVFFNLCSSHTNDELQQIESWIAPLLSRHHSRIHLNAALFARVEHLHQKLEELKLDPEQQQVVKRYYKNFTRAGAKLRGDERRTMSEIMERLASLGSQFGQNVLKDERDWELVLDSQEQMAGLPQWLIEAAAQAANERGHQGKFTITLSRSLIEPFLQFSTDRSLREQAWRAWTERGLMRCETNNLCVIAETIRLRIERAKLMGFRNFAEYKLDDQMAKTPERVRELLMAVWEPAKAQALQEREALQALATESGLNLQIAPWDWRYFAQKQRKLEYDLDESELKPYLQLDATIMAAFDCATRLFGLSFTELDDTPKPHPDARVWEVTRDGHHIAIFIGDYFARPSKRSGAWMSAFKSQHNLDAQQRPIVCNTMNFAKGDPPLLTFDDALTLFHEFGHALHGMLSNVTYPSISGTSVARDFVELPSQLFEHWLSEPEVLSRFACHVDSGAPMPSAMIERLQDAQNFGQGFASVEYTASALVDLEMHLIEDVEGFDPIEFEQEVLKNLQMPSEIAMRHRSPHFTHVFSGDGYSAGYYSYMWSEVMDADAFAAFEETGDVFDSSTARRLETEIYAAGGRSDPEDAYRAFRGRLPKVAALLKQRGLNSNMDG